MSNYIIISTRENFNGGNIKKALLNLPFDEDEFNEAVKRVGNGKIFIVDYDTDIDNFEMTEDENLEELNAFFERFDNLSSKRKEIYSAIYSEIYCSTRKKQDEIMDIVESESYMFYSQMDLVDVAMELYRDGFYGAVNHAITKFIDFVLMAHELEDDGYVDTSIGVIKLED